MNIMNVRTHKDKHTRHLFGEVDGVELDGAVIAGGDQGAGLRHAPVHAVHARHVHAHARQLRGGARIPQLDVALVRRGEELPVPAPAHVARPHDGVVGLARPPRVPDVPHVSGAVQPGRGQQRGLGAAPVQVRHLAEGM